MARVVYTKLRKDGKPRKRNNVYWSPERNPVFVIVGQDGLFFNPEYGWHHRPKLYKTMADALRAIGVHNLGRVGIWEYRLEMKHKHLAESVKTNHYTRWRGVKLNND